MILSGITRVWLLQGMADDFDASEGQIVLHEDKK